jgi:hypothetical protein
LVFNWWNLFVRLADPVHHREAITSRPLLLQAIGRQTSHARPHHRHHHLKSWRACARPRRSHPHRRLFRASAQDCGAKCFLDMLGVFAEFETNLHRER